ncbi:MAG: hypothetical protein WAX77_02935 [Methylococcaceae bacterium]
MCKRQLFLSRRVLCAIGLNLLTSVCLAQLRDPTTPALSNDVPINEQAVADVELVVSAIWISPNSRHAVINGITVAKGDSILNNSVKILGISRNLVIVSQNGNKKTLQLLRRPYQTR